MKGLIFGSLLLLISFNTEALDGTTNPPDEGSSQDTSIMSGGTPGSMRPDKYEEPEKQEENKKKERQKNKIDKEDITDQNNKLDTL